MRELKIDKKIILERIDIVQASLKKLNRLKGLTPGKFMLDDNFAIAEHYLRYALEATFDICNHILSRVPGIKAEEYKQMAIEMGKQGFVSMDFAEQKLEKMAKYRNRLTHFYLEITPKEMYKIIQNNLKDFTIFMKYVKALLVKNSLNKQKVG